MKKSHLLFLSLVVLALLTSANSLHAQRLTFKPQTFRTDLYLGSVHDINTKFGGYLSGAPVALSPLTGVRFTYHYSLTHAFRAGVMYRNAIWSTERTGFAIRRPMTAQRLDVDLQLGYALNYHFNRSQIFLAADFQYTLGQLTDEGQINQAPDIQKYSYNGLGGQISLGYRYFISPYVSLAWENSAYFLRLGSSEVPLDANYPFPIDFEMGWRSSVMLSFHFKELKKRCKCWHPK